MQAKTKLQEIPVVIGASKTCLGAWSTLFSAPNGVVSPYAWLFLRTCCDVVRNYNALGAIAGSCNPARQPASPASPTSPANQATKSTDTDTDTDHQQPANKTNKKETEISAATQTSRGGARVKLRLAEHFPCGHPSPKLRRCLVLFLLGECLRCPISCVRFPNTIGCPRCGTPRPHQCTQKQQKLLGF